MSMRIVKALVKRIKVYNVNVVQKWKKNMVRKVKRRARLWYLF